MLALKPAPHDEFRPWGPQWIETTGVACNIVLCPMQKGLSGLFKSKGAQS